MLVEQTITDLNKTDEIIQGCKDYMEGLLADGINCEYNGYFLYNPSNLKKWVEFDANLKLHPDIYKRVSAISNSTDKDVALCTVVTDKLIERLMPIFESPEREQTRIIIYFNDEFKTGELTINISE